MVMRQIHGFAVGQNYRRLRGQRIVCMHVRQEVLFRKRPQQLIELGQFVAILAEQHDLALRGARLAHQAAGVGEFIGDVAVEIDAGHGRSIDISREEENLKKELNAGSVIRYPSSRRKSGPSLVSNVGTTLGPTVRWDD